MRKSAPQSTTANPGGPSAFKFLITIIAAADALSVPGRDGGLVNMLGSVAMDSGAQMAQFYASSNTIKPTFVGEGEEDSISILQKLEAMHPGNDTSSKEFVAAWTGVPAYIIINKCDGSPSEFYGTPCSPMNLKPSFEATNEKTGFTFVFEQYKGTRFLPGNYSGNQSFAESNTPAGFDIAFAQANATQQYDLAASDTASTSVTIASSDLDIDTAVVLVGGGGANPATIATAATGTERFVLRNGTTWVAAKNASISFKVLKDGTNTYFIEQSRK